MEAAGVEPASEGVWKTVPTCVVRVLFFPGGLPRTGSRGK